jgi:hypothetical protein
MRRMLIAPLMVALLAVVAGCCGTGQCMHNACRNWCKFKEAVFNCPLHRHGACCGAICDCPPGCPICAGNKCDCCEQGCGSGCACLRHTGYAGPAVETFAPGPTTGAVTYPYYTTRGPRDFLAANPPGIGP